MNIEQAILQLKNHNLIISCLLVSIGGVQIMIFNFIWSLYKRLDKLKKSLDEIEKANAYCCGTMTVEGAPHLKKEHLLVFDCVNPCGRTGK
mgnify:CR=1 FL=1